MTVNNKIKYEYIETIVLDINEVEYISKEISPEFTQIRFPTAKGPRKISVYKWCYAKRESLVEKGATGVKTASLISHRIEPLRKMIIDMLNGSLNHNDAVCIEHAFNFIDEKSLGSDLRDPTYLRQLYVRYTNELIHLKNLSNVGEKKGITAGTAKKKQVGMRILVSYFSGVSQQLVQGYALNIANPRSERNIPEPRLNDYQIELSYKLHLRFFSAFTNYVMGGFHENRALFVELEDLGFKDFVAFSYKMRNSNNWLIINESQAWRNYAYSKNGFTENWDKLVALAEEDNVFWSHNLKVKMKKKYSASHKLLMGDMAHRDYSYFFNTATKHFIYLFLYASGANPEHLASLDFSKTNLERDAGANRIVMVKPRAGYEKQTLLVDSKFSPIWRQYLKLRDTVIARYNTNFGSIGIPLVTQHNFNLRNLTTRSLGKTTMGHWPEGGPDLITRPARKYKTNSLLENSKGNIGLVAHMMQRSEEATRHHYSFKKFEDSAKELTQFFDAMYESSSIRINSKSSDNIKAPVITSGKKIKSGHCSAESEENVRRSQEFNNYAPEPRCGAPITCFFCESFGIHATEEDIVKVLSIKVWIKYQSQKISRNIDEHAVKYLPILIRIDEIIESLKKRDENSLKLVELAIARIQSGRADPYWKNKIDALIEVLE